MSRPIDNKLLSPCLHCCKDKIRRALSCFIGVVQCESTCLIDEQNISMKTALWNWHQVQDFNVVVYVVLRLDERKLHENNKNTCPLLLQVPKPVDYSSQSWYVCKTEFCVLLDRAKFYCIVQSFIRQSDTQQIQM